MFSSYKRVFWLAVIMTIFVYVPFYPNGFSTDVWTRLARIREWAAAGFPWREQMTMTHNYPFGFEMHWTRPLDFIGYALAWPFIPSMGLKNALEFMTYWSPLLVMIIAVRGLFFGLRGYLTPKMAFIAFWLFFWDIGYCWSLAKIGYFDHHIFHFALLVWIIALFARSYRLPDNRNYMIIAGVLTAFGAWITVEFFVNIYFLILPFLITWLIYNKSLKPVLIFTATYTIALFLPLTFDYPLDGFWTLDFYRTSIFHVILGFLTTAMIALMNVPVLRTSKLRRLIFGILIGSSFSLGVLIAFADVIITPTADPMMYHTWMKKVNEMVPLSENWAKVFVYAILPMLLGIGYLIWYSRHIRHHSASLILLGCIGTLFYTVLNISHIRFGLSMNAFFIFLAAEYLNMTFFPREHSFRRTVFFLMFYLSFIGSILKGTDVLARFKVWGIEHYLELYKKDPTIEVPKYLKEAFEEELKKGNETNENAPIKKKENNNTNTNNNNTNQNEYNSVSCWPNENLWNVIAADAGNGAVMTDIFSAPRILWETGKPVLAGPYHPNVEGITDLFAIQLDRPPFETARRLLKKHHITQVYLEHPICQDFLYDDLPNEKSVEKPETTFHHAVYFETENMPSWLKLEYHDPETHIKIFRVVEGKNKL